MSDSALVVDEWPVAEGATLPWWKGAVIYQIYPRSFLDTNGDGIGDLKGVHDGLDHIASLGVDGIWISPFFLSPMADFGYDVADFCDVDPIFGTLNDFDRVVEKAHKLGLKVIIDQVYSHSSDQHAWFEESRSSRDNPKADWYVWADPKADGSPPCNWQSVFGGPSWEWDARRGQYYLHNFLKEQPDLNLHNDEVQEALIGAAKFWLDRGVDGFRLDALNFGMHDRQLRDNPPSGTLAEDATRPFDMQRHQFNMSQPEIVGFIERIRVAMDEYPNTFTVAEVGGPDPLGEMKAFTQGDARLNSAYSFDFLYAPQLSPAVVEASVSQWTTRKGEGWPSWAFSNHDAPRAVSRWTDPASREPVARLCMMMLLSLRGNPIVYQGEELGLPQAHVPFEKLQDPEAIANWPKTLGRDGARTPIPWVGTGGAQAGFTSGEPWLPVDPQHVPLAIDQQGDDSMLAFTRSALAIRKTSEALKLGSIEFIDTGVASLVAYKRCHDGEDVIVLLNFSDETVDVSPHLGSSFAVICASAPDVLAQRGTSLPAKSGAWLALA